MRKEEDGSLIDGDWSSGFPMVVNKKGRKKKKGKKKEKEKK